MSFKNIIIGETIGTFILVFIGCSSVATAVLLNWLNLYGVAIVFGAGVTLGILCSKNWSQSHLNPAVTFSFLFSKKISLVHVIPNLLGQSLGALLGGLLVFLVWRFQISEFETLESINRLSADGKRTAMIFGEFFPNPTFPSFKCSPLLACLTEAGGTFILMSVIYVLSNKPSKFGRLAPYLIGLTVTTLIIFLAPYTQGGFNPARDFFPRMVAYATGWGMQAFPAAEWSFIYVYVLSPVAGAFFSGVVFRKTS